VIAELMFAVSVAAVPVGAATTVTGLDTAVRPASMLFSAAEMIGVAVAGESCQAV
jgi:hypothetical protein